MRVGDDERDEAIGRLQDLYARGVLDEVELDERVDLALRARTTVDLAALDADCRPAPARRHAGDAVGVLKALAVTVTLGAAVLAGGMALGDDVDGDGAEGVCVSSGLATDVCPELSPVQEALVGDAERARAAAEQARSSADGGGGEKLRELADTAAQAADRAEAAVVDAQTLVATAPDGSVDDAALARQAEVASSAADVAARSAIRADAAAGGSGRGD